MWQKDQREAETLPSAVAGALARHSLLEGVSRLGMAVSGGSDSMALLHLLLPLCRERGIAIVVLHFNHGLRGSASDGDEAFVQALCQQAGIVCVVDRACGLASGSRRRDGVGISLEMAARDARHAFFQRAACAHRLDAVALAHHRDDVAETLLLRLMRGGGATGLGGMRPKLILNGVTLIRPLLDIGRDALRAWLRTNRFDWREDASNDDLTIPRNHVRGEVLPLLRGAFGPAVDTALARSADLLREDDAVLEAQAAAVHTAARQERGLILARLLVEPQAIRRRVVYRWLLYEGDASLATFATVQRVLEQAEAGGDWQMAARGGRQIRSRAGTLTLQTDAVRDRLPPVPSARQLKRNGTIVFDGVRVTVTTTTGIVRETGTLGALPARCTLSAAALRGKRLVVRYRRPGDRISPLGMTGSRKIQDVLTDAKVPTVQRDRLPLLVCGDEVVWIPGYRIAARYAVPAADAPALLVTLKKI